MGQQVLSGISFGFGFFIGYLLTELLLRLLGV